MVLLLRFWMLISLLGWDTVKLSVLGLGLMWVLLKWVMVLVVLEMVLLLDMVLLDRAMQQVVDCSGLMSCPLSF
jgi:hypothetical protein